MIGLLYTKFKDLLKLENAVISFGDLSKMLFICWITNIGLPSDTRTCNFGTTLLKALELGCDNAF